MTDPAEITAQIAEARSVEWTLIGDDEPALEVRLADSAEWLLKRVAALEAQNREALADAWDKGNRANRYYPPTNPFRALGGEETS